MTNKKNCEFCGKLVSGGASVNSVLADCTITLSVWDGSSRPPFLCFPCLRAVLDLVEGRCKK